MAILQQVFGQEPPVYTKPASMAVPSNSIGSPQFQESLLDKASPSPQHPPQRSFSNGSPSTVYTSPELHRRTGEGIYQLNQSLAVCCYMLLYKSMQLTLLRWGIIGT